MSRSSPFGPRSAWTENQPSQSSVPRIQAPQGAQIAPIHSSSPGGSRQAERPSAASELGAGIGRGLEKGVEHQLQAKEYAKLRQHQSDMQEDEQAHQLERDTAQAGHQGALLEKGHKLETDRMKIQNDYKIDQEIRQRNEQQFQDRMRRVEGSLTKLRDSGAGFVNPAVVGELSRAKAKRQALELQRSGSMQMYQQLNHIMMTPGTEEEAINTMKKGMSKEMQQGIDTFMRGMQPTYIAKVDFQNLPTHFEKLKKEGVDVISPEGFKAVLGSLAESQNIPKDVVLKEWDGYLTDNLVAPAPEGPAPEGQGQEGAPPKIQKGTSIGTGASRGTHVTLNSLQFRDALSKVRNGMTPEEVERFMTGVTNPIHQASMNHTKDFGMSDYTYGKLMSDIKSGRKKREAELLELGDLGSVARMALDDYDMTQKEIEALDKYLDQFDERSLQSLPNEWDREIHDYHMRAEEALSRWDLEGAEKIRGEMQGLFERYRTRGDALQPKQAFVDFEKQQEMFPAGQEGPPAPEGWAPPANSPSPAPQPPSGIWEEPEEPQDPMQQKAAMYRR